MKGNALTVGLAIGVLAIGHRPSRPIRTQVGLFGGLRRALWSWWTKSTLIGETIEIWHRWRLKNGGAGTAESATNIGSRAWVSQANVATSPLTYSVSFEVSAYSGEESPGGITLRAILRSLPFQVRVQGGQSLTPRLRL